MNKEIWVNIPNYDGYQVSNLGRLKSLEKKIWNGHQYIIRKEKILKGRINTKGYIKYALYQNKKPKNLSIHRLVAEAFIPNPDNLPQINHIDGNKQNNCVDNLEWCTNGENQQHAWINGLQKKKIGKENHNARQIIQSDLNDNVVGEFDSIMDAVRFLNIKNGSHIVQCCKGERNKAYNYKWKYKEEL